MKDIENREDIFLLVSTFYKETNATNWEAERILNYNPKINWKESIDMQIAEMKIKQYSKMKMNKDV